jgi:hypothetical protein
MDMVKIDLTAYWNRIYAGTSILNTASFAEYRVMREWLANTNTQHEFKWNDTGMYLPDCVWIDITSDTATIFKLKYL